MPKLRKLLFGPRGCCGATTTSIDDFKKISYQNFNELNLSKDSTLEYDFEQRCFLKIEDMSIQDDMNLDLRKDNTIHTDRSVSVTDRSVALVDVDYIYSSVEDKQDTIFSDDSIQCPDPCANDGLSHAESWSLYNVLDLSNQNTPHGDGLRNVDGKRRTFPRSKRERTSMLWGCIKNTVCSLDNAVFSFHGRSEIKSKMLSGFNRAEQRLRREKVTA